MSRFLRACRGEAVDATPIWLMRQAGRYQAEYRSIRSKVSFVELCMRPDLASEVTVMAARQLGVDAAIIFADILLILGPLGVPFTFEKGDGPKILKPIRSAVDVDAVAEHIDAAAELHYVMEAIRQTRAELTEVPLIGFAGAPFTLASYAIEGGGSKNYYETKKLMFSDKGLWDSLMQRLVRGTATYLNAQVDAGAEALQIFDSWVGCLSADAYRTHVQPHMETLFASLDGRVPVIHFGTGNPAIYPAMCHAGGDVLGVDWRVDLRATWDSLPRPVPVMGNLDPGFLLATESAMLAEAGRILRDVGGKPGHIFNLGHGIMPEAQVPQVQALVRYVHEASAAIIDKAS